MTTIKTLNEKNALVSKAFAKKAVIFGTEEYKLWREYKKDFPEAKMATKSIKRNPNKKTNRNLTYENMVKFIEVQDNSEELMKEFKRQQKLAQIAPSPYHAIVAWFRKKFEKNEDFKAMFADKISEEPKEEYEAMVATDIEDEYEEISE